MGVNAYYLPFPNIHINIKKVKYYLFPFVIVAIVAAAIVAAAATYYFTSFQFF